MNSALVLLASISVAFASLAGIVPNLAATNANREDRFDIVTINPTTGAASSTQKQIFAPYDGVLDFSNIVFSANGQLVISLQGYDYGQVSGIQGSTPLVNMGSNPVNPWNNPAYLARQDLAQGGRYEYCALSQAIGASQPINIFWDSPTSVVATAVGNGIFSIVRYSFVEANTFCAASIIGQIPSANGISPIVKASRGSNIYFVTEPFGGFTASQTAQIRAYSVSATAATPLFNNGFVTLPANIFPVSLVALSDELVSFQAWNAALSGTTAGFGTYEVNLRTYVSGTALVARTIASSNEELSVAQTFLNQTGSLFSIKNAPTTTLSVQPFLASTSYAQANTAEVRQTTAINTNNIFFLFDLANSTLATIDADASTTVNTVILTGTATFAGVINGATTPVGSIAAATSSRCRVTFTNAGAITATQTVVNALGQGNGVACTLTALPATAGVAVDVEFAADGVNYNSKISYTHNGVATSLRFAQSSFTLRDATPVEAGAQAISVELLDASGRKILFPTSTTTVTITAQGTGAAVLRGIVGNTATATNGRAVFPYLAVDVDAADNDGIARVLLTASFAGSSSAATLLINVRIIKRTSSTLAAIAFPTVTSGSQAFETQLVDPRDASKNQRINARALSDVTGTLALGLSAYDNDNKVLNTVEVSSSNLVILNGVVLGGSSTKGAGACILPSTTTTNLNDAPSAIWYERTNADLSVDFLAVITVVDASLGQGRRLVRYNRLAGSLATSRCTFTEVDRLPVFDNAISNQHTVLLTDGRIAFFEPDFYFPTVTATTMFGSSLLHVWRISTPTVAGAWLIRNKVLSGFQVVGVTQSATNELAINGQSIPTQAVAKSGIWLVDISAQTSPVVAPSTSIAFPQVSTDFATAASSSEQAFFLAAGSPNSFADNRYRYTASVTAAGVQQLNTVHLSRATTGMVPDNARVIENAGRNYVDFFTLDDAVITSLSPAQVAISNAATITATANNVITGPQLKCRFTSAGVAQPVEFTVSATASVSIAVDATTVNCGPIPTAFIGADRWVYVQISNDNGLNYGPEGKLAIGNPVNPTNVAGTGVSTTTSATTVTFAVHLESDINACPVNTAQLTSVTTAVDSILAQFIAVTRSAITTSCLSTATAGVAYDFTVTATSTTSRLAALQIAATLASLQAAFDVRGVNSALLTTAGIARSTVALGTSVGTISSNKLSNGAIAGIVIACVVGGLAIFGAIGFAIMKAGSSKKQVPSTYAARDVVRADSGASSSSDYDSEYDTEDYSEDDYSDYV